ncbi:MAG TPA: phosphoribosylformylglycinamidine synthase, partial [Kiritimatiellae bacterium]|nr:phosphoribosylformylglycinamidine synthase [Kiritimatiellia bacterium]
MSRRSAGLQGRVISFIRGPLKIPVHRLEVGLKPRIPDARGRIVRERARTFLGLSIRSCRTRDVYKIAADLSAELRAAVKAAFTDPVTSVSEFGRLAPPGFDWLIEIGYKPGVTDNLGRTAQAVVEDVAGRRLAPGEGVYTSTQYFIRGDLSRRDVERLARRMLANTLIQQITIYAAAEWRACPPDTAVPHFRESSGPLVRRYDLEVGGAELMQISRDGILALSLQEMRAIRDYYRREDVRRFRRERGLPAEPTDVELECIAQTWSEHCKHKIFSARIRYRDQTTGEEMWINSLFNTYIRRATEEIRRRRPWLVSV